MRGFALANGFAERHVFMPYILHHYERSNFSEKARLLLAVKGLSWRSVEVPSTAPKPDFTPLTGGHRRTPALQIGADIYLSLIHI